MSKLSDYFTDEELASNDNGVVLLDIFFAKALLLYREALDLPLIVNSCCRSINHNTAVGGASSSYHLYEGVPDGRSGTMAIDLSCNNSSIRARMVSTALNLGWSVGVYKTFIHIDRRVDLGKPQILFYGD